MEETVTLSMLEKAAVSLPSKALDWTKSHFTIGECSRALHLAPRTVARWFDDGILQGYRFPLGERRVSRSSLLAVMHSKGIPVHQGKETFKIVLVGVSSLVSRLVQSVFGDRTRVIEATNIFQAGQLCGEHRPSFVALDYSLGRTVVLDAVQSLKQMKPVPCIAIILPEDGAEMSWDGVIALPSPCDPVQVVEIIRAEARRRKEDL